MMLTSCWWWIRHDCCCCTIDIRTKLIIIINQTLFIIISRQSDSLNWITIKLDEWPDDGDGDDDVMFVVAIATKPDVLSGWWGCWLWRWGCEWWLMAIRGWFLAKKFEFRNDFLGGSRFRHFALRFCRNSTNYFIDQKFLIIKKSGQWNTNLKPNLNTWFT